MSNKIRVKVYADGDFVGETEFDQDVIKIGSLASSNLRLDGDGVARMHAVFERSGDIYRIIDLGSASGCVLDDIKVDKNATLPKTGTLKIGSFKVEYELDHAPKVEPRDPLDDMVASFAAPSKKVHHYSLLESLILELKRLESSSAQHAEKMLARWPMVSENRKREWLRLLVGTIREERETNRVLNRKRVATMLNIGMEGMEAIYALTPSEAFDKAYETLMDMALSKTALEMLGSMGLAKNIQRAFFQLPPEEQEKQHSDIEGFVDAHDKVSDRLQNAVVAGGSLLPVYLSRAGGRDATDEDRAQWKAAFDQIKAGLGAEAANEAN